MSGSHLSKEFFDLIKNIGEAKSKQEEDHIISEEISLLQTHMSATNIPPKKMREYLLRVLYCEMLGHDASFGHIHGVNMTQQPTLLEKRVGYLTVMCTLHTGHELIILLINTIRKDLQSSNWVEVCAALTCVCKLINKETIPAVLPLVVQCLSHSSEFVRKKAVMAMHRFFLQDPFSVTGLPDHINRAMCDRDPCVMAASLNLLDAAIKHDPAQLTGTVPSLVSILKQIIEHRLHASFDYHRTPAPWCQIQLLRVMAVLGQSKSDAEEMYEVLNEVLRRADTGINVGYAVSYECVRTICKIYPNTQLIDTAAAKIGEFLKSENQNLRYMGLNALSTIIQVNPKYAAEHQLVVIDCLEDPDETLKRKTLALLFKMTNQMNVGAVVEKMIHHLKVSHDEFLRTDLVSKITELAERFAPSNPWYLDTMNTLFEEAGPLCRKSAVQNLLRLLAEGTGGDEEADTALRQYAVSVYVVLCQKPRLGDTLTQVMSWVLGEYTYLTESVELEDVTALLCDLMDRTYSNPQTKLWIISAITKLVSQIGFCSDQVREVAERFLNSADVTLHERCLQLLALSEDMDTMQAVLPVDASCEAIEIDQSLGFLDDFITQALANGANEYIPPEDRVGTSLMPSAKDDQSLRFEAYDAPKDPYESMTKFTPTAAPTALGESGAAPQSSFQLPVTSTSEDIGLKAQNVKKKWGDGGYDGARPTSSATPVSSSASVSSNSSLFSGTSAPKAGGGMFAGTTAPTRKDDPEKAKQKLEQARSLFGDLSGASVAAPKTGAVPARKPVTPTPTTFTPAPAPAVAVPARARPTKPTPAAATPAQTSIDSLLDLADLMSVSTPAPTSTAPPTDIMSLMMMDVPAPQPAAQPKPASVFSGLGSAANGASAQRPIESLLAPTPAPSNGGGVDGLGLLLGMTNVPAAQPPITPLGVARPAIAPLPFSGDNVGELGEVLSVFSDTATAVTVTKRLDVGALIILVDISNSTASTLRSVGVLFDLTGNPGFAADIACVRGSSGHVKAQRVEFSVIGALSTSTLRLTLTHNTSALPLPVSAIRCQFQYTAGDPGRLVPAHFTIPVTVVDFISPHILSEAEFGGLWGSHAQERKSAIKHNTLADPVDVVSRLQELLHVAHVKTIKAEIILAAKDSTDRVCLVHCKVTPNTLHLTVRSKDAKLSDALHRVALAGLQNV
eukprot:c9888_g1_i1.p1 GENE.c9888_g1_i1~~c9888_g1_i1.p1  ORF type:complete len:1198 (+),score=305.45 c9888_g1_i1:40-3594(+)